MFLKSAPKDIQVVSLLILLSLFLHFYNFSDRLNFSMDQAKFSLKALELWEEKKISLIGPSISFNVDGREIFQGGVIYYFLLLFLLLGNSDPLNASALFAFFSIIMAIPLYIGIKLLTDKNKALVVTCLYLLAPIFINHTNFLWNPNFQLALLPVFFLLLGLLKKTGKILFLIFSGIWMGILIQFHYQMVLGLLITILWMRIFLKIPPGKLGLFVLGILVGFSPVLIFEFQNDFNSLGALIYLVGNINKLDNPGGGILSNQHYYLSLLLVVSASGLSRIKEVSAKLIVILIGILIIRDAFLFLPKQTGGFGMAENWQYQDEERVFRIIREQNLDGYNFTNLEYDSLYYVQKYLHQRAGLSGKLKDYWETEKLFAVIKKDENPDENPAYEIRIIKPYKQLGSWDINNYYKMYLLEKVGSLQGE